MRCLLWTLCLRAPCSASSCCPLGPASVPSSRLYFPSRSHPSTLDLGIPSCQLQKVQGLVVASCDDLSFWEQPNPWYIGTQGMPHSDCFQRLYRDRAWKYGLAYLPTCFWGPSWCKEDWGGKRRMIGHGWSLGARSLSFFTATPWCRMRSSPKILCLNLDFQVFLSWSVIKFQ